MRPKTWMEEHEKEFIDDICELVRIPSVSERTQVKGMPFGKHCLEALEKALEIGRRMGFQTYNHEGYCASLLWNGETESEIGLFGHTDVVPAGDGWSSDPYQPAVKDGVIIGRGSSDNKGSLMSALYALRYLKETGYQPRHSFRFFLGSNEEKGMEDISYYTEHYGEPEFSIVPDVQFPVCNGEKGILEIDAACRLDSKVLTWFQSGIMSNSVPASASAVIADSGDMEERLSGTGAAVESLGNGRYSVSVRGIGAHAAFPEGSESAEVKLAKILLEADILDPAAAAVMKAVVSFFGDYYGAGLDIPFEDSLSGKLTHVGGMARYDGKVFRQNINIRYNVKADYDEMIKRIENSLMKYGFFIEKIHDNKPCFTDPDSPAAAELVKICNDHLKMELKPYVMGGGTYARKLKHAVGFGPGMPGGKKLFGETRGSAHQPDEYAEIKSLKAAFEIYVDAIRKLDELV
ncbi:MAG: Sapep family Mn(2+)-dependent dipeptidase [Lacrimispora sp.]|uniref:Sapep family Mn(2+)-dependent dipeptidase n=1 Tax=Lacrimispora sp. TaxID=2719234 RepID=UPI0039E58FAA